MFGAGNTPMLWRQAEDEENPYGGAATGLPRPTVKQPRPPLFWKPPTYGINAPPSQNGQSTYPGFAAPLNAAAAEQRNAPPTPTPYNGPTTWGGALDRDMGVRPQAPQSPVPGGPGDSLMRQSLMQMRDAAQRQRFPSTPDGPTPDAPRPPKDIVLKPFQNPMVYDRSNWAAQAAAEAARDQHMQAGKDMAAATNEAVGNTLRQNANRVTATRIAAIEAEAQKAQQAGQVAHANALIEQARQEALARQYEAAEKTKRLVHAMRMFQS